LVAIVPAIQHELVEPRDAIFEERAQRFSSGAHRDELVQVAHRTEQEAEAPRREHDAVLAHAGA
jgi:hypothetical protein